MASFISRPDPAFQTAGSFDHCWSSLWANNGNGNVSSKRRLQKQRLRALAIGRPFVLLFSARRLVAGAAQVRFEILQPVAERTLKQMQRLQAKEPLLAPSLMQAWAVNVN